jgi:spore maturation protein CgeB
MNITILGLSITSSWGNGHATTYRGLVRELAARGHRVLFLERDMPWAASTRDLETIPGAQISLYKDVRQLKEDFTDDVRKADVVIIGSCVPEGIQVAEWVLAAAEGAPVFYDLETPVTLAKFERNEADYLTPELIPKFPLYLSFAGGPTLERLEKEFNSPMARSLYCAFDPQIYFPEPMEKKWDLGFLGTYSADRHVLLQHLLIEPAGRWPGGKFVVAGPQYPPSSHWPSNVERIEFVPPPEHRRFYNEQLFTLNITRAHMAAAGYCPSVRLFEAAACGTPIITDEWDGLEEFFEPGEELMVARDAGDTIRFIQDISSAEAREIGEAARKRALANHTAARRAKQLEDYLLELTRAAGTTGSLSQSAVVTP